MLKYFISFLCLLSFHNSFSQEDTTKQTSLNTETPIDSVAVNPYPRTYGLRVGIDLIKPIVMFTKDDFSGGEIVADYRLSPKLFVAGELGYTDKTIQEDEYNHTVNGTYLKAGLNYNMFVNWLDMDNEIYLGFRYGFATFTNQLNSYTVFQGGNYFDDKEVTTSIEHKGLNAHWVELVVGVKVEVLNNLYLGFMANVNKIIGDKEADNLGNTYSPGFGGISENGSGANINYTISYRIPLYKK